MLTTQLSHSTPDASASSAPLSFVQRRQNVVENVVENVAATLHATARRFGHRPAVTLGNDVCWDYRGLAERSARIAGGLAGLGLAPGDAVAVIMPNCVDFYPVLYGIWHAGLVAVPINPDLPADQIVWMIDDSGARVCIAADGPARTLQPSLGEMSDPPEMIALDHARYQQLTGAEPVSLAEPESGGALAWVFYTSGTTGRPKGVMLSHRNLIAMIDNYLAEVDRPGPHDCLIHASPMTHGSGMTGLVHVRQGANQVIPRRSGFDPEMTLALIERWPGATVVLAPSMVNELARAVAGEPERVASLATVLYGGAPMYISDLRRAVEVFGARLIQLYGLGESPLTLAVLDRTDHLDGWAHLNHARLASAGRIRSCVEVRVVDEHGQDVPVGCVGQVLCRSDVVALGYLGRPRETADKLRGGWLHTGDLGILDEGGYLTVKGRSQDVIATDSGPVYPRDVEDVLVEHPAVREASVVAHSQGSDRTGQPDIVAFVALESDAQLLRAELDQLCAARLAAHQRPAAFVFASSLPKNRNGKLVKARLRHLLAENPDIVSDRLQPWSDIEAVGGDGIKVRVARSISDAQGIRDVLHSAWRVSASEPYFYRIFNEPEALYRAFIEPALATDNLLDLDVLCMVAERPDGRIVGTFSLILDHHRRTAELGRGAVAKDAQGRGILQRFVASTRRAASRLSGYATVADVTTLAPGATTFAHAFDCQPVALHPGSFVVQASCVDAWLGRLARRHGDAVARALLWRSDRSGLGRFATAYHMDSAAVQDTYLPYLTDLQRPFYQYTRDAALCVATGTELQPALERPQHVSGNPGTGTQMIVDPDTDSFDLQDTLSCSSRAGFETVVIQVPCDARNRPLSHQLEAAGGILSGVFPRPSGHWYASYTFATEPEHTRRMACALSLLWQRNALDSRYSDLLRLVIGAANKSGLISLFHQWPEQRLSA